MTPRIDLNKINAKIQLMKKAAEELNQIGEDFPALARNAVRILASVKMLEINVSDLVELD
jgi:chaperonin cofactor prefoldin